MAEEEKVHPLVSTLLGQNFVPRIDGEIFRYDRDEMMRLKEAPLSVTRPDNLSSEFDGDDGKFSPFKWLEHRWEVEGIKNRPQNKKLQDTLRTDCEDSTGLSPQRRGFSSGCRAPVEDKKDNTVFAVPLKEEGWNTVDNPKDRSFSAFPSKWKAPPTNATEKFNSLKGNDFKLPFQKVNSPIDKGIRTASWKTVEGKERQNGSFTNTGKFMPARSYRGMDERSEKLPEWADDPTTMDDMIELKGFDEPPKKIKTQKIDSMLFSGRESQLNSRPPSRETFNSSDKCCTSSSRNNESMPTVLPDTDAELAAILGLMDLPPGLNNVSSENSGSNLTGSRMSKFFNRNAHKEMPKLDKYTGNSGRASVTDDVSSNPALVKLFLHSSAGSPSSPTLGKTSQNVKTLRLEDLEKSLVQQRYENGDATKYFTHKPHEDLNSKGSPLQDPHQQAQLLQKLNRVALQQEQTQDSSNPLQNNLQSAMPASGYPATGVSQVSQDHIIAAHAQQLLVMHLQQTFPGGIPPIQPQILDRMRSELIRTLITRQQHAQAMTTGINMQQNTSSVLQQSKPARPAMIPASVQRHMSKANTTPADERREKDREDDPLLRQQSEALKKQQMQQQYSALMNAMQNGLPLAALRPGAPSVQQPNPQQMAMMAAQMQAQQMHAQQRLHYLQKQQQQAALMKLMSIQQNQNTSANNELERLNPQQSSNNNAGSEILQVGPIQTPLEKLLTAAGVQPSQFTGSPEVGSRPNGVHSFSSSARPMSLEEVERNMATGTLNGTAISPAARPLSLEELERHLTEKQSSTA